MAAGIGPSTEGKRKPRATAYFPTPLGAVSSALKRFTAVFGMGTGGATPR